MLINGSVCHPTQKLLVIGKHVQIGARFLMTGYTFTCPYIKQCGPWADMKLVIQTIGVALTAQEN